MTRCVMVCMSQWCLDLGHRRLSFDRAYRPAGQRFTGQTRERGGVEGAGPTIRTLYILYVLTSRIKKQRR